MLPVLELNVNPLGSAGEIEKPFGEIVPPTFVTATVWIAELTKIDCTEFDRTIFGEVSAATTVRKNVAVEVPPAPVAVTV